MGWFTCCCSDDCPHYCWTCTRGCAPKAFKIEWSGITGGVPPHGPGGTCSDANCDHYNKSYVIPPAPYCPQPPTRPCCHWYNNNYDDFPRTCPYPGGYSIQIMILGVPGHDTVNVRLITAQHPQKQVLFIRSYGGGIGPPPDDRPPDCMNFDKEVIPFDSDTSSPQCDWSVSTCEITAL